MCFSLTSCSSLVWLEEWLKVQTSSRLIDASWPIPNHNATNYRGSSHNQAINVTLSFQFFTHILCFPPPVPVYYIALKSHLSSLLPWASVIQLSLRNVKQNEKGKTHRRETSVDCRLSHETLSLALHFATRCSPAQGQQGLALPLTWVTCRE